MNSDANPRSFEQLLDQWLPKLSASERQALNDHFHYISSENTDEIETDVACEFDFVIRRALVGRYPICRKLHDDIDYWEEHNDNFKDFSGRLQHEPCTIAAGLAIRPSTPWEESVVEAWSWVFRLALAIDVAVDKFEDWLEFWDPATSRAFLTSQLTPLRPVTQQSDVDAPALPNAANGNA